MRTHDAWYFVFPSRTTPRVIKPEAYLSIALGTVVLGDNPTLVPELMLSGSLVASHQVSMSFHCYRHASYFQLQSQEMQGVFSPFFFCRKNSPAPVLPTGQREPGSSPACTTGPRKYWKGFCPMWESGSWSGLTTQCRSWPATTSALSYS